MIFTFCLSIAARSTDYVVGRIDASVINLVSFKICHAGEKRKKAVDGKAK